jgi:hypothetical protein
MKRLIPIIIISILSLSTFAQQKITRCYTKEVMNEFEKKNPGYTARVNQIFDEAKANIKPMSASRSTPDTIFKIRTVFHIVYTSAVDSIPDSWIYSQIEVLNEDFRRKNADTNVTRAEFLPFAGDAKIEFALADQDPDGFFTSGITRTKGTPPPVLGFSPFNDEVKSYATGGRDPWSTDKYLNIWVCNVFNGLGILGYAFPPDNAPNWPQNSGTDSAKQGVVMHYPVVGRLNTTPIDQTVAKGRSAVHEIGHYLGLRHIWGDGDCTVDDGIEDTPDAIDANQQTCDYNANTCNDSPIDYPDMLENFMDYSDDRCLNMFTHQQISLMRYMLRTSRAGIVSEEIIEYPASVNDVTNQLAAKVYPNPTQGSLNIEISDVRVQYATITILNLVGQQLKPTINWENGKSAIDVSDLADGVYILKIKSDLGEKTEKILLQHK